MRWDDPALYSFPGWIGLGSFHFSFNFLTLSAGNNIGKPFAKKGVDQEVQNAAPINMKEVALGNFGILDDP